jgi:maltose O-acetyltransferase
MDSRKNLVRKLAHVSALQAVARLVMRVGHVLDRFWSHLRFRTLVPQAGDSLCHWTVALKHPHNLRIGNNVRIGYHAMLGAASPIVIGDDVVISQNAMIETGTGLPTLGPPYGGGISKPITIERGAWIAAGAIVLGGVTIGEGAIIGAGAVIARDIPPWAIVNTAPNRMFVRKKIPTPQAKPVSELSE